MKSFMETYNKMKGNKFTKPILYFGFYFIFFAVVILFASVANNNESNQNPDKVNMWSNISNNYQYLYDITLGNNQIISLEGKIYGNKNLFTKKINGVLSDEVYLFYKDVSIKKDNKWTPTTNFILVDKDFDENLLNIRIIRGLVNDAELINSSTSFDGVKKDSYTISNYTIEVESKDNNIQKITIVGPTYSLYLQYKNINGVKDFVITK